MTQPAEPRQAESMAITLTRMEGKLDGVVEKVSDLRAEVTQHRGQLYILEAKTQQLASDARGAEETRIATANAVKQADEARVAAAKAQVDNSTQRWTPAMRLYATLGALAAVVAIIVWLSQWFV